MNASETRRPSGSFLPEIPMKRRRKGTLHRSSDSVQSGSESGQPAQILSKAEISLFRNSVKQNICVEMLQEGFHRSFSELFFLLSSDQELREAAEPGSAVRLQTPLEEQLDKLETIRLHLTQAEQAERTGSWSVVCEHRLSLGRFFSAPEDLWLSLHFFHSCADREQGRLSRPAAEARASMAELYMQQGELEQAMHQAATCIEQVEDDGWLDSAGRPLRLRARQTLWRIYSWLADALLDAADVSEALKLLHKGHSMATESGDKQMEGEAAYRLGLTYQSAGDHDAAKQFFSTCMQICGTLQDADGLGKAYQAMAKSVESEGDTPETVWCLEKLVDIARSNGLKRELAEANLHLGNICYRQSQHERAQDFFLQGYKVSCSLGDVALLQKAQVLVASAQTHTLMGTYGAQVRSASPDATLRLLEWKSSSVHQELGSEDPHPAWN